MAYAILGQMKKQLTDRRQYLEDVITRKRELVEKKREILDTKYTAEEKANKMDKMYLDEQERETALNSELKSTSERMYKITQEIFDYKGREKNLEADINGSSVTMNNLQAKTNKLDHEALKQQVKWPLSSGPGRNQPPIGMYVLVFLLVHFWIF